MSSSEDLPLVAERQASIALNSEVDSVEIGSTHHDNVTAAEEGQEEHGSPIAGSQHGHTDRHIETAEPMHVVEINEQNKHIGGAEAEAIAAKLHQHRATVHTLIINSKTTSPEMTCLTLHRVRAL